MLSKILSIFKSPANLPSNIVQLMEQDFVPLEMQCGGIVRMVVRYVTTGEGEEVLLRLKGMPNDAVEMKMHNHHVYANVRPDPDRPRFRLLKEIQDPSMLCRLGRTYQALIDAQIRPFDYATLLQGGAEWFQVLLEEWFVHYNKYKKGPDRESILPWDSQFLEDALSSGGSNPDILIRCFLWHDPTRTGKHPPYHNLVDMKGIKESFARHPETLREALKKPHFESRAHALEQILEFNLDAGPFIQDIALMAVENAGKVRGMAITILKEQAPAEAIGYLKVLAETGSNEQRFHAVVSLWKVGDLEVRPFLEERLEKESSKKTVEEITRVLSYMAIKGSDEGNQEPEIKFDLPPVPDFPTVIPLSEESKQAFREMIQEINKVSKDHHAKLWDETNPERRKGPREIQDRIVSRIIPHAIAYMEAGEESERSQGQMIFENYHWWPVHNLLLQFVGRKELSLIHGWRFFHLLIEERSENELDTDLLTSVINAMSISDLEKQDLRAHAKACKVARYDVKELNALFFSRHLWLDSPPNLPLEAVWPYFAENIEILENVFTQIVTGDACQNYSLPNQRLYALHVLTAFPHLTPRLSTMLWQIALEGIKAERAIAQVCLAKEPQMERRIIAALKDSKKDVRTIAAEWLGRVGTEAAIPELKKAFVKEKHDEPKAEILEALERLGAPIDEFLDIDRLNEEAQKGLSKGIPKEMAWLPIENIPSIHWENTGESVEPDILKWFLVQTCNLGNPEPSPLLRKYMAFVPRTEREILGEWILDIWLAHDLRPKYTYDEAIKMAEADVQKAAVYYKRNYPNANINQMIEDERKKKINWYLNNFISTAMPSKGILAITAACAGPSIVPKVQNYLKQWYGYRVNQCKVLIQMLSWVDHPLAIQLILAVGARFRTKGIQNEAIKYTALIAERRGWTPQDLADRTAPTAGFDENGIQEIDYGERKFTARLAEDFNIVLTNSEGKEIKALPDANKTEDEADVKAQKAAFSASKKELKQTLKLQKDRLYEAMCTERVWRYEDWDLYLLRHPIVGHYCQQLVWQVERRDKTVFTFRPLPDRTLVDYNDEDVHCGAEDQVRLAHQMLVSTEVADAWLRHLKDYNITPLFAQFGKELYVLTDDRKQESEIRDFEGHMTEAFRLRSRMNKLGYTRGETGDGGYFCSYVKRFHGLKLEVSLEFTGNSLPEENRPVALECLRFIRMQDGSNERFSFGKLPIVNQGSIPPVLLSECYNDIRQAAMDGPGFDPDWRKKSEL